MLSKWATFLGDENGATGLEYALIAALISILLIGGASAIGTKIGAHYNGVANRLP